MIFDSEDLKEALTSCGACNKSRGPLPALSCVRFEPQPASPNTVMLTATDLEKVMRMPVGFQPEADHDEQYLDSMVPLSRMRDIVSNLPDDSIALKFEEGFMSLSQGRFKADLLTMDGKTNAPAIKWGDPLATVNMSAVTLLSALSLTRPSISTDSTRPNIAGLCIEQGDCQVIFVATDGRRMTILHCDAAEKMTETFKPFSVPRESVDAITRIFGQDSEDDRRLTVEIMSKGLTVRNGEGKEFSTALVKNKFPDWRKALPKKLAMSVNLNRDEFASVLRRCMMARLKDDSGFATKLTFEENRLVVETSSHSAVDMAREEILIKFPDYPGFNIDMIVNPEYITENLSHMDCSIVNVQFEPNTALVFTAPDKTGFTHIVMPRK